MRLAPGRPRSFAGAHISALPYGSAPSGAACDRVAPTWRRARPQISRLAGFAPLDAAQASRLGARFSTIRRCHAARISRVRIDTGRTRWVRGRDFPPGCPTAPARIELARRMLLHDLRVAMRFGAAILSLFAFDAWAASAQKP